MMLTGLGLLSLKTCLILFLQSLCAATLKPVWLIYDSHLCPLCHYAFPRTGQASGAEVTITVARVLEEDHCPFLFSLYFIVRRFGLGNAFQNCYITAVTGTDVDLSSVWFKERVWAWRDQDAGELAHRALIWKHHLRCSCRFKGAVQCAERPKSLFIRGSQERAVRTLGRVYFIREWMSVSPNERI